MSDLWMRLLPMAPILIEGVVALGCGIYQLISGKESFLMYEYRKKYNYEKNRKKFVKMCAVVDISLGIMLTVLLPVLYVKASAGMILFISIPILCVIGIGQRVMLCRLTDNLEDRKL